MTNSKNVFLGLGSILAIGLGWYFLVQQPAQNAMMNEKELSMTPTVTVSVMEKGEDAMVKPTDTVMMEKPAVNRYVPFTSAMELEKMTPKKTVLYFYANWCPTCIPANAEIEQRKSEIPEDVMVVRVNYNDTETSNEEKDLAKKYGITYQHTFVLLDEKDAVVKKWNGGSIDELISNVN